MAVRHGAAHYRMAEESVAATLREAAATGALREGTDVAVMARQIATLMAGHTLICERSDTLEELPARVTVMWEALLPLIATEDWLAQHLSPGRPARAGSSSVVLDVRSRCRRFHTGRPARTVA